MEPTFDLAQRGAPRPILAAIHACGSRAFGEPNTAFAMIPFIENDPVALAVVIRGGTPEHFSQRDVFLLASQAAFRRDASRLAHDAAHAAEWNRVFGRLAAVLRDRRKATLLLLPGL